MAIIPTFTEKIMVFLSCHPNESFTIKDISDACNVPRLDCRDVLDYMVKNKVVKQAYRHNDKGWLISEYSL